MNLIQRWIRGMEAMTAGDRIAAAVSSGVSRSS